MSILSLITGITAAINQMLKLKASDEGAEDEMDEFARELDEMEARLDEQEAQLDALEDEMETIR